MVELKENKRKKNILIPIIILSLLLLFGLVYAFLGFGGNKEPVEIPDEITRIILTSDGVKFNDIPNNLEEIQSEDKSLTFEMWHYSGAQWADSQYNPTFVIKDNLFHLDAEKLISEVRKQTMELKTDLPYKTKKEYERMQLENKGENIVVVLEARTNEAPLENLFYLDEASIKDFSFSLDIPNQKIHVKTHPKIDFLKDEEDKYMLFNEVYPDLQSYQIALPLVDPAYGYNVYSMWWNGKNYGMATGIVSADDPHDLSCFYIISTGSPLLIVPPSITLQNKPS